MDVRAAYESIGANYDDVVKRLSSPVLVERFAGKFLQDESYPKLVAAIEAGDAHEAFLAAHTLKGIALNLGLSNIAGPASELTEELRDAEELGRAPELLAPVTAAYEKTVSAFQG